MPPPNNILDANVEVEHTSQLQQPLKVKQIGVHFLPGSADDERIISLLSRLKTPTFITWDCKDFYHRRRLDKRYCIICSLRSPTTSSYGVDIHRTEFVSVVRKIFRHPLFNTVAKRMGKVIRVTSTHINYFEIGESQEITIPFQP
ncbi:hypothetical protein H8E77_29110 [bacterium]|nr:hypothetical protein [bacterium]